MADSIRQQIIDALKTRLEDVTTINVNETEVGSNIFEWRTTDWQESELEGINIRDTNESVEVRGGNHACSLDIELEAKVAAGTSPAKSRAVIADVTKAIGSDPRFGGLVQHTTPVENEMDIEQKDKKFSTILMKFNLKYVTKAFSPFTLA